MESNTIWIVLFIILIAALYETYRNEQRRHAITRKKRMKGRIVMGEAVKKLIGKECIITTGVGSSVVGIIESVEDSWVVLRSKGNLEMINLDYVSRIREYPRNKNGKKKTVFA